MKPNLNKTSHAEGITWGRPSLYIERLWLEDAPGELLRYLELQGIDDHPRSVLERQLKPSAISSQEANSAQIRRDANSVNSFAEVRYAELGKRAEGDS